MPLATDLPFCPFATYVSRDAYSVTIKNNGDVDFSAYPRAVVIGQEINFINLTPGEMKSVLWDFGDGTTSTAANPRHAYSATGEYTVRLTVEGPCSKGSVEKNIGVTVLTAIPAFDYELCGFRYSIRVFSVFLATPEDLLAGNEAGYIEIDFPYEITELGPEGKHTRLIVRFGGGEMPYSFDFSILNLNARGILYYDDDEILEALSNADEDGNFDMPDGKISGDMTDSSGDIVFTIDPDADPTGTTFLSATDSTGMRITVSVNVNTTGASMSSSFVMTDKTEPDDNDEDGGSWLFVSHVTRQYLSDSFQMPEGAYVRPEDCQFAFDGEQELLSDKIVKGPYPQAYGWERNSKKGFFEEVNFEKNCVYSLYFRTMGRPARIYVQEDTACVNGEPVIVLPPGLEEDVISKDYPSEEIKHELFPDADPADNYSVLRIIVPKGMHGEIKTWITGSYFTEKPVTDAEGNPVTDENGDPITETVEIPYKGPCFCKFGVWKKMPTMYPVVRGTDTTREFTLNDVKKFRPQDSLSSSSYECFEKFNMYSDMRKLYDEIMLEHGFEPFPRPYYLQPMYFHPKPTGEIIMYADDWRFRFIPSHKGMPYYGKCYWYPGAPCEKDQDAEPDWVWTADRKDSEPIIFLQQVAFQAPVAEWNYGLAQAERYKQYFMPIFKHLSVEETLNIKDFFLNIMQDADEYPQIADSVDLEADSRILLQNDSLITDSVDIESSAFETGDGSGISDNVIIDVDNNLQKTDSAGISDDISFEHFHGIRAFFTEFRGTDEELTAWIRDEVGEWITVLFVPELKTYKLECITSYEEWRNWKRITDMGLEY